MKSTAVANNATNRSQKGNATQVALWSEEQPIVYHQLIEVHFQGGREAIYCTAKPYRPTGGYEIYAGYVGFPVLPEDCSLCTREAAQ